MDLIRAENEEKKTFVNEFVLDLLVIFFFFFLLLIDITSEYVCLICLINRSTGEEKMSRRFSQKINESKAAD